MTLGAPSGTLPHTGRTASGAQRNSVAPSPCPSPASVSAGTPRSGPPQRDWRTSSSATADWNKCSAGESAEGAPVLPGHGSPAATMCRASPAEIGECSAIM